MSFAIVTGNGFTTNAQRVNNDGLWTGHTDYGVGAIFNSGYSFILNYKYDLTFKHRSSSGVTWFATPTPWDDYNGLSENMAYAFYLDWVASNEGTALLTGGTLWTTPVIDNDYQTNHWFVRTTPKHLGFACPDFTWNDHSWIEIDEVNLYHIYCPSYPMCSTLEVSNFSDTGMTLTGVVNPYGLSTTAQFKVVTYDPPSTNYYTCNENPIFSAKGMDSIYVSKIIPYVAGSSIYYTMNAYNSAGSFTGNTVDLIAPKDPTIYIEQGGNSYPTNFTLTGITLNALIDLYWLPTNVVIEWGTSLSYGETTPVLGMIASGISYQLHIYASLTGLSSSALYYYRVKATTDLGTVYHTGHTFRTLSLMDTFQGGKAIYFSNPAHTNGIVITENDISTGATWGCTGDTISTTSGFFAGSGNTVAITNICSGATNATIAAKLCLDLSWSGYTDWWLPSYTELLEICPYKVELGMFDYYYWSSQQLNSTQGNAFHADSFCVYTSVNSNKGNSHRVRAVRYF